MHILETYCTISTDVLRHILLASVVTHHPGYTLYCLFIAIYRLCHDCNDRSNSIAFVMHYCSVQNIKCRIYILSLHCLYIH